MPLLDVRNLQASYGKAIALEGVDLHVRAGTLVGVLGPNGAGKTTLLRAISQTVSSSGALFLGGQSLMGLPPHEIVALGVCHCPEGRHLFPELTVRKNLELGAYLRPSRAEVESGLEQVFQLFPILKERLGQQAGTLSGGQQQFVAIARALMGKPKLLLLDEPSVGIAHKLKIEIFDAIQAIAASGVAVLMAEQDAQNTLRVAEYIYVLENGAIARHGQSETLVNDDHIRRIYLGV